MTDPRYPGILPILRGGLGNQLFCVAAAYVASKAQGGCPIYIIDGQNTNNDHNHMGHNYIDLLFRHFHGAELIYPPLSLKGYMRHSPLSAFHPWFPCDVRPGTVMDSYYQYYPPLAHYEGDIRRFILKGLQPFMPVDKAPGETAAFLHIRRGDYLKKADFHYIQPLSYYETALQKMKVAAEISGKSIQRIYVLSDDMAWVKQQDLFKEGSGSGSGSSSGMPFTFFESENELEALALMASCKAGAICANSTFSWWGAFLGAYAERAPVYVPKRWIAQHVYSLIPEEWNEI